MRPSAASERQHSVLAPLGIARPGSNPGFVTCKQCNLGEGYLLPLSLNFLADQMEEDSTYLMGAVKAEWGQEA